MCAGNGSKSLANVVKLGSQFAALYALLLTLAAEVICLVVSHPDQNDCMKVVARPEMLTGGANTRSRDQAIGKAMEAMAAGHIALRTSKTRVCLALHHLKWERVRGHT